MKKRAAELRSFIKNFWRFHQLDKDMTLFYGGSEGFPMSDASANLIYKKKEKELIALENKLNQIKTTSSTSQ